MVAVAGYIVIFFVFGGTLAYLAVLGDSVFGDLDFASSKLVANQLANIIKQQHLESSNFYDLGSAKGAFAIRMAKKLPELKVYGCDSSGFRILISKIRALFVKNAKFKKQDIFTADVSSADIVYLYLPQDLMPTLETKLQKELKPGALVISNSVSFPSWPPSEILAADDNSNSKKLFIYKLT